MTELSVKPFDFSDAGNAEIFIREYKEDVIYIDSMGWLCWDGRRWVQSDHMALQLAIDLSDRMLKEAREMNRKARHVKADLEANTAEGDKDKKALDEANEAIKQAESYLVHAKVTRRAAREKAILELACPSFVRPGTIINANPWDLNTPACIINLATGEVRPNEHGAYCSRMTAVKRDQNGAEIWDKFLDSITCNDNDLKAFLQMSAGMSLYGKVYQEGAFFAVGGGANGKSTYYNTLAKVYGDYAGYINIDVLTTSGTNKGATYATLRGKRLIIAGEMEEGRWLSASTLKKLTSTDPITAEEKYRQPEDFVPTHTLCAFTNHLPRISATDEGTWRRIFLVPFNAQFTKDDAIPNYSDYLVKNAGGAVLAWAVEGARKYAQNGFRLDVPESVRNVTKAYRARENWLINFLDECCVYEANARIGARELYTIYREWAEDCKRRIYSEAEFAEEMKDIGIQFVRPKGYKFYIGIKLNYSGSSSVRRLQIL